MGTTHHHSHRRVENEVREGTPKSRAGWVVIAPLERWDGDDQTLHEGDGEGIGIHEHRGSHCKVSEAV